MLILPREMHGPISSWNTGFLDCVNNTGKKISRINRAQLKLARIKRFLSAMLSVLELMLNPYRGNVALQKCVLQNCKVTKWDDIFNKILDCKSFYKHHHIFKQ